MESKAKKGVFLVTAKLYMYDLFFLVFFLAVASVAYHGRKRFPPHTQAFTFCFVEDGRLSMYLSSGGCFPPPVLWMVRMKREGEILICKWDILS